MKVQALQGDTVDLLCQRHYGTTQGVTEIVLAANKALAGQIFLDAGQVVELPEISTRRHRRPCSYGLINRIWNGVTYSWSTLLTSVGVMTQKDWLAAIGVLIGIAAAVLGELHRRRMARIQETNNTLLNELIDAIRDDTENRQDVKELIRTIREAPR
jgi:phage tail protein X